MLNFGENIDTPSEIWTIFYVLRVDKKGDINLKRKMMSSLIDILPAYDEYGNKISESKKYKILDEILDNLEEYVYNHDNYMEKLYNKDSKLCKSRKLTYLCNCFHFVHTSGNLWNYLVSNLDLLPAPKRNKYEVFEEIDRESLLNIRNNFFDGDRFKDNKINRPFEFLMSAVLGELYDKLHSSYDRMSLLTLPGNQNKTAVATQYQENVRKGSKIYVRTKHLKENIMISTDRAIFDDDLFYKLGELLKESNVKQTYINIIKSDINNLGLEAETYYVKFKKDNDKSVFREFDIDKFEIIDNGNKIYKCSHNINIVHLSNLSDYNKKNKLNKEIEIQKL